MNLMDIAEASLLAPYELDTNKLDQVFDHLVGPKTDLADLYFQSKRSEGWMLEDSIIKSGSYNITQGVGVRAVSGEKSGFAYSDEISMDALMASAKSASAISKAGQNGRVQGWQRQSAFAPLYTPDNPLDTLSESEKIELLRLADKTAREASPYVEQVIANVVAVHETVLVADHNGHLSADVRPLVRMSVTVIIEKDGKRESAGSGGGGRFGLNYFAEADRIKEKDEGEARALVRTNERLKRLGKDPVENLDDIPEVIEELDPFLEEAALITQDYINYGRIAKK